MENRNQRGQILIESIFLVLITVTVLIAFQIMIDHQKTQYRKSKISTTIKDISNDEKTEFQSTK